MEMRVTIPANTRASVTLPGAALEKVMEGSASVAGAPGVAQVIQVGEDVQVEVASGVYLFSYPLA